MSILEDLDVGPGFAKIGVQGFQGSGKTHTSVELACGIREFFKLPGPLAMADTETGSAYVRDWVRKVTGLPLKGKRTRSFDDLMQVARACESGGVSVLIVDSITHFWRDVQDSYLRGVNEARAKKKWNPRTRLEFQDWAPIKAKFNEWTDFFLNSKLHIIICGRLGYEYDFERNEENGGKDLIKTGTKMKAETEFGYEPSLLLEMERERVDVDGKPTDKFHYVAHVLKDRFRVINGQCLVNPTWKTFKPWLQCLCPGQHAPVDTDSKTHVQADEAGNIDWQRQRQEKDILLEEIKEGMAFRWPATSGHDKQCKLAVIKHCFQTVSWTAVEKMTNEQLKVGLEKVKALVDKPDAVEEMLKAEVAATA